MTVYSAVVMIIPYQMLILKTASKTGEGGSDVLKAGEGGVSGNSVAQAYSIS